jgi:phospholipid/cholesterol/gamma-HCH transport system substrate-binding protein
VSVQRPEAVKAGVFVVLAITAFVVMLVFMLGRGLLREEVLYTTVFDHSVAGLDPGASVSYLGVPAGSVTEIHVLEGAFPEVEVTMVLSPSVPVTEGTRATLSAKLLTGIARIELVGGKEGEERLAEGSRIPARPSGYERVYRTLPEIADRLPRLIGRLEGAAAGLEELLSEENRERVLAVLGELEASLAGFRESVLPAAEVVSRDVESLARRLEDEVARTSETARATLAGVRADLRGAFERQLAVTAGEDALEAVVSLRRLAVRLEAVLARAETALGPGTVDELAGALVEARALVAELRRDPAQLLLSAPAPERAIPEPELHPLGGGEGGR